MNSVRRAQVAGRFYPGSVPALERSVDTYVGAADPVVRGPAAVVAPHAGYVYSGPTAGYSFASLAARAPEITRVVLIGPSHYVGFSGFALSSKQGFETPLGVVPVDRDANAALAALPQCIVADKPHDVPEHALEVELPFLQRTLGQFSVVPIIAGSAATDEAAEVLEAVWGGDETAVVVSSDLSHFHDYDTAVAVDGATTRAIEALDATDLRGEHACGHVPLRGLLEVARRRGLRATTLDLRNSGDTAGDRDRVVGYGAYAFH